MLLLVSPPSLILSPLLKRAAQYLDHAIADLLQMMGRASRPIVDSSGKALLLCHTPKKATLKKLLYEPLPIESHLDQALHDHVCSEVVTKTIENQQDCVDWITWTLLYRRLSKNPNYYNMQGTSPQHLSEHLSEMVERVLGDLDESKVRRGDWPSFVMRAANLATILP